VRRWAASTWCRTAPTAACWRLRRPTSAAVDDQGIHRPVGDNSFAFPILPAPLGDTQPAAADTVIAPTRVFWIPSIADCDALRKQPSANVMCLEFAVRTGDVQRVILFDM
jgi:hypothetical protein